jgi:hypothetical protein
MIMEAERLRLEQETKARNEQIERDMDTLDRQHLLKERAEQAEKLRLAEAARIKLMLK